MLFALLNLACTEIEYDDGHYTENNTFYVIYESNPSPIPLNEYFSITVTPYADNSKSEILNDVTVYVDAIMPDHNHGMNEEPETTLQADGSFLSEGLKWHMEGLWELQIYVTKDYTEMAAIDIECCS